MTPGFPLAEPAAGAVLRLLREIRVGARDTHRRLVRVEGKLEEMLADTRQAMGAAGLASIPAGKDEIAALKRRVQELEARK